MKHSKEKVLDHSADDLRWATSEAVADYRASRLKCRRIVDAGCGIGLQAFSFARKCRHVLAIDISADKIDKAKRNAEKLGIKNIEFLQGDALDKAVIGKILDWKPEIIFLDPHRPEGEDRRKMQSIIPDPERFIETYSKVTDKIAIELPPQMQDIDLDAELEYLSLDGELRRLTAYFAGLKKAKRSAILLPGPHRLESSSAPKPKLGTIMNYIYEVDPAIVKADLLGELCALTDTTLAIEGKNVLVSSQKPLKSPFFKKKFKVLERMDFDHARIIKALIKHDASKVVIRYGVDPSQYWKERNALENGLTGSSTLYLFKSGDEAIVCDSFL